ncbi:hypothetical protein XENTR_v10002201 [Xenopus tropicalis]|nr:hypothetical protein XENTR_v10002201 [Xenopus tropicalis]
MISHKAAGEGEAALFQDSRLFGFNPKFKYVNVLAIAANRIVAVLREYRGSHEARWDHPEGGSGMGTHIRS